MLGCALAGLALLQAAVRAPADDLIERADLVAIARVTATPKIEGQGTEVAELAIERVLFGPDASRAFACASELPVHPRKDGLTAGRSYVLFLEASSIAGIAHTGNERSVEAVVAGAPVFLLLANGSWELGGDGRVLVPPGVLPSDDAPPAEEPQGTAIPRETLVDWLVRRIDRSLPSIRARVVSTGPVLFPVSVFIAPDGSVRGEGATTQQLSPAQLRALWELVAREGFGELPDSVGGGGVPCGPMWTLEIRRREGRKLVRITGEDLESLAPPERDAAERALRIWKALPLESSRY